MYLSGGTGSVLALRRNVFSIKSPTLYDKVLNGEFFLLQFI